MKDCEYSIVLELCWKYKCEMYIIPIYYESCHRSGDKELQGICVPLFWRWRFLIRDSETLHIMCNFSTSDLWCYNII
jgi:hypothetical protein